MPRRFELVDAKSNKYWEVWREGTAVHARYGKMGTAGRVTVKDEGSAAKALKLLEQLVAQKTGKGYLEVAKRSRSAPLAPAKAKGVAQGPMSEALFWDLIGRFAWKKTGDDRAVLEPCVTALSKMSIEDIHAFDDLLAEKLYALDTRAVCRGVYRGSLDPDNGDDYVSADDFLYSRCVIVANGKKMFDRVLAHPEKAPQDLEFESLLYLASEAFTKKTGKEYDHAPPLSWESFSNKAGWAPTGATKQGKYTGRKMPPGNRRPS